MNKDIKDTFETYTFQWEGIEIEVIYWPLIWGVTSHLEIRSLLPERAPLPITETGYKSHFFAPESVDLETQSIVEIVQEWLDSEAKSKDWVRYVEDSRQGDLFGNM